MKRLFLSTLLVCSLLGTVAASAKEVRIAEDFGLFDQHGDFHRLSYYHKDPKTKGIVVFIHGIGCPLVRLRYQDLEKLSEVYASKGIQFWMLNANDQDEYADLVAESEAYKISLPILDDASQEVARSLGVDRTGEAILIETTDWQIVFRGAIDDRLTYESKKTEVTETYLKDAMDALLAGKTIETAKVDAPGCLINYPAWEAHEEQPVSYAKDVAPLIREKCSGCHMKGGIGPFAFTSYRKARGWADMMREVVMTRRMPPWQADPHHGTFDQDLSLTPEEQQILLHWIEQGTRRGEGNDLLAMNPPEAKPWNLGKPDYILNIPEQHVPADGIIEYRYIHQSSPFEKDTWITGADVHPGHRQALHHVIIYIVPKDDNDERKRRWLTGYAPGVQGGLFPKDSGILLRKDERLLFELHYTSYGKETTDRTQIGLYLAEGKTEHVFRTGLFIDQSIKIPPHSRAFPWSQSRDIEQDIILYSMNPHMHYRGKAMRFELETPDGQKETLVSVPHYNFNWQHTYVLAQPRRVPKGSKLILHAAWDNSERNPANPNPAKQVKWGQQSYDEMFFGTFQYVLDRGQSLSGELLSSNDQGL